MAAQRDREVFRWLESHSREAVDGILLDRLQSVNDDVVLGEVGVDDTETLDGHPVGNLAAASKIVTERHEHLAGSHRVPHVAASERAGLDQRPAFAWRD